MRHEDFVFSPSLQGRFYGPGVEILCHVLTGLSSAGMLIRIRGRMALWKKHGFKICVSTS